MALIFGGRGGGGGGATGNSVTGCITSTTLNFSAVFISSGKTWGIRSRKARNANCPPALRLIRSQRGSGSGRSSNRAATFFGAVVSFHAGEFALLRFGSSPTPRRTSLGADPKVAGFGARIVGLGSRTGGLGARTAGLGARMVGLGARTGCFGSTARGVVARTAGLCAGEAGLGARTGGFGAGTGGFDSVAGGTGSGTVGFVSRSEGASSPG